jgi:hypothetical protein
LFCYVGYFSCGFAVLGSDRNKGHATEIWAAGCSRISELNALSSHPLKKSGILAWQRGKDGKVYGHFFLKKEQCATAICLDENCRIYRSNAWLNSWLRYYSRRKFAIFD